MQNAVCITEESLPYLTLVTAQDWPSTSEWLQSIKGRLSTLHSFANGNMYLTRNPEELSAHILECPYMSVDKAFLENNADKYIVSPYID